jgi:hypothetical protein
MVDFTIFLVYSRKGLLLKLNQAVAKIRSHYYSRNSPVYGVVNNVYRITTEYFIVKHKMCI